MTGYSPEIDIYTKEIDTNLSKIYFANQEIGINIVEIDFASPEINIFDHEIGKATTEIDMTGVEMNFMKIAAEIDPLPLIIDL